MNSKEEVLTSVLEILDNHCHGGYQYYYEKNKFTVNYPKCSELHKDYDKSLCSQCPFGKQMLKLGSEMSLDSEIAEDKATKSKAKLKIRWTEEEDKLLSSLIYSTNTRSLIIKKYKEKFGDSRRESTINRRIHYLHTNEEGLVIKRKTVWTTKDMESLTGFVKSGALPSEYKRGRFPLYSVYNKFYQIKNEIQNNLGGAEQ